MKPISTERFPFYLYIIYYIRRSEKQLFTYGSYWGEIWWVRWVVGIKCII